MRKDFFVTKGGNMRRDGDHIPFESSEDKKKNPMVVLAKDEKPNTDSFISI